MSRAREPHIIPVAVYGEDVFQSFGEALLAVLNMPPDPGDGFNNVAPTTPERVALARKQRAKIDLAVRIAESRQRDRRVTRRAA